MYGTIFEIKVKDGHEQALIELMSDSDETPEGMVAWFLMKPDDGSDLVGVADDRIIPHIDDMDLDFVIITSDPDLVPDHPRIKCVPWQYQYGYHMQLITNTGIYVDCEPKNFLCMMRNHKPERLAFLNGMRLMDMKP